MQSYLNTFLNILEPIIQRGVDSGEFRNVDAHQITLAYSAQLEGTLLLWAYAPDMMALEDQLRTGGELLLRSLMVDID